MSEKNTNNDTLLDCHTCAHSVSGFYVPTNSRILICTLSLVTAEKRCELFIYDPVTDEGRS